MGKRKKKSILQFIVHYKKGLKTVPGQDPDS